LYASAKTKISVSSPAACKERERRSKRRKRLERIKENEIEREAYRRRREQRMSNREDLPVRRPCARVERADVGTERVLEALLRQVEHDELPLVRRERDEWVLVMGAITGAVHRSFRDSDRAPGNSRLQKS
jgi:hypothetical protein